MQGLETDDNGFVSEGLVRARLAALGWEALGLTCPVLCVLDLPDAAGERTDGSDLASRVTLDREAEAQADPGLTGGDPARYRGKLALLRKRPGNPFPNVISIGRALSCDLVLSLATVSKFQGYFRRSGDEWSFLDQRSLNGTRLGGVGLEPNRLYPLSSGDEIAIADEVRLLFLEPVALRERLEAEPTGV